MASGEGFLTDEQREMLKIASQNVDTALPSPRLSSSPKSPTSLLSDHQLKVPAGGKAPTGGIAVRHVRRSHSGKSIRVKKGEPCYSMNCSNQCNFILLTSLDIWFVTF